MADWLCAPLPSSAANSRDLLSCEEHNTFPAQVFYHLGELDDALTYALGAGALFDTSEQSEYVQTILCTHTTALLGVVCCFAQYRNFTCTEHFLLDSASCIDRYVELRRAAAEGKEAVTIDERLTAIVERLFNRYGTARCGVILP